MESDSETFGTSRTGVVDAREHQGWEWLTRGNVKDGSGGCEGMSRMGKRDPVIRRKRLEKDR